MKDLTVIIPLYKFDEQAQIDLAIECVKSITKQVSKPEVVLFVLTKTLHDDYSEVLAELTKILGDEKIKSKLIKHDGDGSIQQQVNLGVKEVKTDYFSVVEADDTLYPMWFENVAKRVKNDIVPVSLYLPIIYNINGKGEFIRLSNEVVWSLTIAEDGESLGFIDGELLETFSDFQVTSGVFRTEDFKEVGGLKENIEIFFWNELLMRLKHNDKVIYVIPKYGGNHLVGMPFSYVKLIEDKFNEEDISFWYDTIKEEYVHIEDRKIKK